jgi:hypothetical protein
VFNKCVVQSSYLHDLLLNLMETPAASAVELTIGDEPTGLEV